MSASELIALRHFRSKLFVPGSRPELFAKAATSAADAVSFDLQDAVPEDRKDEAREAVAHWLANAKRPGTGKTLIVRTNGVATTHFGADIEATVRAQANILNIPAVDDADMALAAVAVIAQAERRYGVGPVALIANIETPSGLHNAAAIAKADRRMIGLQTGYGDLFERCGIDRKDNQALAQVRLLVRFAAAAAGGSAWDGAYPAINDPEGFQAECEAAYRHGFAGKSCIHPSQLATANAAFTPTRDKLEWARRVVAADEAARAEGLGAVIVDGRMIDAPFVAGARALLASPGEREWGQA